MFNKSFVIRRNYSYVSLLKAYCSCLTQNNNIRHTTKDFLYFLSPYLSHNTNYTCPGQEQLSPIAFGSSLASLKLHPPSILLEIRRQTMTPTWMCNKLKEKQLLSAIFPSLAKVFPTLPCHVAEA